MMPFDVMKSALYFDALYRDTDDPWEFRTRWYEDRKRALTMACLPSARYGNAFEPGCANAELSARLTQRCDQLLVADGALKAVEAVHNRFSGTETGRLIQAWVPDDWSVEQFDMIVISEFVYYLESANLTRLAERILTSLYQGGTVVDCHWRRPIDGCKLTGDDVHDQLHMALKMPHVGKWEDADLRIDVWCSDSRSVAEKEDIFGL